MAAVAAFADPLAAESGFILFSQEVSASRRLDLSPPYRRPWRTPGWACTGAWLPRLPANLGVDLRECGAVWSYSGALGDVIKRMRVPIG